MGVCALLRYAMVLVPLSVCLPVPVAAQLGSNAGRVPVLLVPGWGDGIEELEILKEQFLASGWPASMVLSIGFSDPVGSNSVHAAEVADSLTALLARNSGHQADLVAHSMGGLAVRAMLLSDSLASRVRRVVFLGTPHHGTQTAHLGWGEGAVEMKPGSLFLVELNTRWDLVDGVQALSVRTRVDLSVVPGESAVLAGASNVEVCCPTHAGLLTDPGVFERVRNFLLSR